MAQIEIKVKTTPKVISVERAAEIACREKSHIYMYCRGEGNGKQGYDHFDYTVIPGTTGRLIVVNDRWITWLASIGKQMPTD
jgi:hypothetical protein